MGIAIGAKHVSIVYMFMEDVRISEGPLYISYEGFDCNCMQLLHNIHAKIYLYKKV